MKQRKRIILMLMLIIFILTLTAPLSISAACSVSHECGAWCEAWGDCGGRDYCSANSLGVDCMCANISVHFPCQGLPIYQDQT